MKKLGLLLVLIPFFAFGENSLPNVSSHSFEFGAVGKAWGRACEKVKELSEKESEYVRQWSEASMNYHIKQAEIRRPGMKCRAANQRYATESRWLDCAYILYFDVVCE